MVGGGVLFPPLLPAVEAIAPPPGAVELAPMLPPPPLADIVSLLCCETTTTTTKKRRKKGIPRYHSKKIPVDTLKVQCSVLLLSCGTACSHPSSRACLPLLPPPPCVFLRRFHLPIPPSFCLYNSHIHHSVCAL